MYSRFEFSVHSFLAIIIFIISNTYIYIKHLIFRVSDIDLLQSITKDKDINLTNHVVVITGANTGIGKETATSLAKYGATVILGCRDVQKGIETASYINNILIQHCTKASSSSINTKSNVDNNYNNIHPYAQNGKAIFMRLDLNDELSIIEFSNKIKQQYVSIDILINNAGINTKKELCNGIQQLFQVNYLGHFLLFRCLENHLSNLSPNENINNNNNNNTTNNTTSTTTTNNNNTIVNASSLLSLTSVGRVINLSSVMHHTGI